MKKLTTKEIEIAKNAEMINLISYADELDRLQFKHRPRIDQRYKMMPVESQIKEAEEAYKRIVDESIDDKEPFPAEKSRQIYTNDMLVFACERRDIANKARVKSPSDPEKLALYRYRAENVFIALDERDDANTAYNRIVGKKSSTLGNNMRQFKQKHHKIQEASALSNAIHTSIQKDQKILSDFNEGSDGNSENRDPNMKR